VVADAEDFATIFRFGRVIPGVMNPNTDYFEHITHLFFQSIGPTVGVKPFLEFTSDFGSNDCGRPGLMLSASVGMQATVGAKIHIGYKGLDLYSKDFPSKSVYSYKKGIASGCLIKNRVLDEADNTTLAKYAVLGASDRVPVASIPGFSIVNNGLIPGTTWSGTIKSVVSSGGELDSSCHGMPNAGILSLQVISNTGGVVDLIGSTVWSSQSLIPNARSLVELGAAAGGDPGDSCVLQTGFVLSYYESSGDFIIKPQSTSSDYSACANGPPTLPYGWYGTATKDLVRINAVDSMRCSSLTLQRSTGLGPPPPSPPTPAPNTSKCKDISDEGSRARPGTCLAETSCGWCIDANYNSGCCGQDGNGQAVLPCTTLWGDTLADCSKGFQPGE
jgi:hypothetical protein